MTSTSYPTVADIEQAKKDMTDINKFIALSSENFNDNTGKTRLTLEGLIAAVMEATGYVVAGTFSAGCTVTAYNQIVSDGVSYWRWGGALDKVVTAGSSPTPSGISGWNVVSDGAFKDSLAASNSTELVGGVQAKLINEAIKVVTSGSASARNIVTSFDTNFIDPEVKGSSIFGIGWITFPNKIGFASKPVGTDYTNPSEWANDTGYTAATINDASVATITGGYDHINNQIAGTICGGGHNFIQYNSEGHSLIGGGSYNWISSGRAAILYGTNNRVSGESNFNAVHNGYTNKILGGGHNNILGGELVTIDTPAQGYCWAIGRNIFIDGPSRYASASGVSITMTNAVRSLVYGGQLHNTDNTQDCAILGGLTHTMTGTFNCGVVGGESSTMTNATYAGMLGGRVNTQSGRSSVMVGAEDSDDKGTRGLFTGRTARGMNAIYHVTVAGRHPSYASGLISQAMRVVQCETTVGANLNAPDEQQVKVGNTLYSTITGTCFVTARNVTDGTSAGYKVDFVAQWNGTTYFLNGATADLAMTVIYQNVSSNITAPTLAFSTGALRVRFGGTASKTVHWSAVLDIVLQQN